jgi:hypothetical protein
MTFKHIILAASALGLMAAAPAFAAPAADVTGTVTVTGSVAAKCLFTTDSDSVVIPELADTTGHLEASTVNTQSAELVGWCNGTASTMRVEANHLEGDFAGSPVSGFTDRVDYTATATAMTGMEGSTATAASDSSDVGGAGAPITVGLFASPIAVTFSDAAADGRLVAGDYEGSVDVTLSPAL